MSINMRNEYDVFVKKFVHDNWATISVTKKYRQVYDNGRDGCINYMPANDEKPEPDYIGNSIEYQVFLAEFVAKFIIKDGLKFDIQGHMPELHGHQLSEFLDDTDKTNRAGRSFSRESLVRMFNRKLLMDVFTAFMSIRDKDTKETSYFLFLFDDNRIELKSSCTCPSCDAYIALMLDYEKNAIVLDDDLPDCKLPKKATRVNVTLKSPSGKLVFLNEPSQFFKLQRENQYEVSINSTLGCIEETKFYAKHNIGFFFIGNTTAYIMQKDGEILATLFDDEDDKQIAKYKDYKLRGDVCTGVWWYTVLDHDLYLKLCEERKVDPASIKHTVVKTKALKYKVSHSLAAHAKGHHVGVYSKITY